MEVAAAARVLPAAGGFVHSLVDWSTAEFVSAATPAGRSVATWRLQFDGNESTPGTAVEIRAELDARGGLLRNASTGQVARVAAADVEARVRQLQALAAGTASSGR